MPCRATYLNDPVFGGMRPAVGIGPGGQPVADQSGTVEPLPVVMFEPVHTMMITNRVTGMVQEARTDAIVANGFRRITASPLWIIKPAPGWEVRRQPGELILLDGAKEIWACGKITPEPAWVSAAASYGHVAVFFGPNLGVRTPPDMRPADYTTTKRAAEFRRGRGYGLVTAATVTWRGEAVAETLDWMTFLPGSFSQPLPGLFAPLANFARHGGPEAFGLSPVREHGLAVPADPIKTLVAQVSHTDIDLSDPGETTPFDWIGGVHYAEGIQETWLRAALTAGRLLLLTGPSLPGQPAGGTDGDFEALTQLWGAVVPVQALLRPKGARRARQ